MAPRETGSTAGERSLRGKSLPTVSMVPSSGVKGAKVKSTLPRVRAAKAATTRAISGAR